MLAGFLILIGYLLLALSSVSAVGYCLYQWAVVDIAFKYAAWNGFVLWLTMFVGGFTSLMVGTVADEF